MLKTKTLHKKSIIKEHANMKKLTVLLTVFIVLSNISICSFAYEATKDEESAVAWALNFYNIYNINANVKCNNELDIFPYTIEYQSDDGDVKKVIIEKAKEYEDEIRKNHCYYFEDENIIDKQSAYYENEMSAYYGADPAKSSFALQYDNTPIEEVISSFPVFINKKTQYMAAYNSYVKTLSGNGKYLADNGLYVISPKSVIVSESGFAYVNFETIRVLLYKWKSADQVTSHGVWIVCDVFINGSSYDSKYRFNSENMDVEKELSSEKERLLEYYTPLPEQESSYTDESGFAGTYSASEKASENEANNPPQESKPINYVPWIICGIEAVAIIALVIALVLKKRNNIRAVENEKENENKNEN